MDVSYDVIHYSIGTEFQPTVLRNPYPRATALDVLSASTPTPRPRPAHAPPTPTPTPRPRPAHAPPTPRPRPAHAPPTGGRNVQHVPCNVANAIAQRWPIDTINGLQYFMGKPLNMRIYREKAHIHSGIGQNDEQQWRQELRALTDAIGLARSEVTGHLVSNGPAPVAAEYPQTVSAFSRRPHATPTGS